MTSVKKFQSLKSILGISYFFILLRNISTELPWYFLKKILSRLAYLTLNVAFDNACARGIS
jgi:hypothetical protein